MSGMRRLRARSEAEMIALYLRTEMPARFWDKLRLDGCAAHGLSD